jgi:hypothetical protein
MYSRVWTQSEAAVAEASIKKIGQDHPEAPRRSPFAHLKVVLSRPTDQTIEQTVGVTQLQKNESQIKDQTGQNESNSKRKGKTEAPTETEYKSRLES